MGLLNPFFECTGRGWLVDDLTRNLAGIGGFAPWRKERYGDQVFDVEAMRRVLEEMMGEAGVELLYYTLVADAIVEDQRLRGVAIESKAGREAHASYRVTGTAMALGQAAGIAAAWAVRDHVDVDAVDGRKLRAVLRDRGAKFAGDVRVAHQQVQTRGEHEDVNPGEAKGIPRLCNNHKRHIDVRRGSG